MCFFNDTATTEIYTLSLHDALPISTISSITASSIGAPWVRKWTCSRACGACSCRADGSTTTSSPLPAAARSRSPSRRRSEEHTSELQSRQYLVCRLLLEKKNGRYRV